MTKQTSIPPSVSWETKTIKIEEKPCKHIFAFNEEGEFRCKKCGFGLIGVIDIVDGKPV